MVLHLIDISSFKRTNYDSIRLSNTINITDSNEGVVRACIIREMSIPKEPILFKTLVLG